ncbi:MAG: ribosome recycling factor [Dehalococcoidia bacterium]
MTVVAETAMIDETLTDAEQRMAKAVEALRRELATVRTGRASPALIEHLRIDYYGTPTPLNQLATIAVPDARLLTVQPWDKNALGPIEKSIQKSDLGLNPSNDGNIIRLAIPPLTEDRRKDMVKTVHKKVEDGRVSIRNVRRDAHEMLRELLREKDVSEDEEHRAQEQLQKVTDRFIAEAENVGLEKERELMEV